MARAPAATLAHEGTFGLGVSYSRAKDRRILCSWFLAHRPSLGCPPQDFLGVNKGKNLSCLEGSIILGVCDTHC